MKKYRPESNKYHTLHFFTVGDSFTRFESLLKKRFGRDRYPDIILCTVACLWPVASPAMGHWGTCPLDL